MRRLIVLLATVQLFRIWFGQTHAYMDPGSGSMMIQILLGGVAGLAVVARLFWHRISGLFTRRRGDSADDEVADGA